MIHKAIAYIMCVIGTIPARCSTKLEARLVVGVSKLQPDCGCSQTRQDWPGCCRSKRARHLLSKLRQASKLMKAYTCFPSGTRTTRPDTKNFCLDLTATTTVSVCGVFFFIPVFLCFPCIAFNVSHIMLTVSPRIRSGLRATQQATACGVARGAR